MNEWAKRTSKFQLWFSHDNEPLLIVEKVTIEIILADELSERSEWTSDFSTLFSSDNAALLIGK